MTIGQERWTRGDVTPRECYGKGQEHRAYHWTRIGLYFGRTATPEQIRAYNDGYDGKPFIGGQTDAQV
jgi:hypothetical protein